MSPSEHHLPPSRVAMRVPPVDGRSRQVATCVALMLGLWLCGCAVKQPPPVLPVPPVAAIPGSELPPGPLPVPIPQPAPPHPPSNRSPTAQITCDPCAASPGGAVRLTAAASDPDGDPLTFQWSATTGTLSADGTPRVEWTATGNSPGVISVTVTDGRGGLARATLELEAFVPE